jgi:hypothetical protein
MAECGTPSSLSRLCRWGCVVASSGSCSQIHDGMWNTGTPHHNHAALLKVRVLAPSSESCGKCMAEFGTLSSLSRLCRQGCLCHHLDHASKSWRDMEYSRPSSLSCSAYKGEGAGAIIRIMPQNSWQDMEYRRPSSHSCSTYKGEGAGAIIRMRNTGVRHHNHAALSKVRGALAPSSGSCFRFMTGCWIHAPLITIMQHL